MVKGMRACRVLVTTDKTVSNSNPHPAVVSEEIEERTQIGTW